MDKATAIAALGGTVTAAAKSLGVSYQAFNKAPDPLGLDVRARSTEEQAEG